MEKRFDTQAVLKHEGLQGYGKRFKWEMDKHDVLQKKQEDKSNLEVVTCERNCSLQKGPYMLSLEVMSALQYTRQIQTLAAVLTASGLGNNQLHDQRMHLTTTTKTLFSFAACTSLHAALYKSSAITVASCCMANTLQSMTSLQG